jgi:L-ascorbate metabolism protein UlaG (beta-lactamase superfamily)
MRLISFGHAAVLIDTGSERILVDPWLTQRLDRFWMRWPAIPEGLLEEIDEGVDCVILSHHHYDHHHFPSLRRLAAGGNADFDEILSRRSEIMCVYPRSALPPRFTASGLGHQAIPWTLRRLGYCRLAPVRPGDMVQVGHTRIRTFVSDVPFPEMSILVEGADATVMLCGDSVLAHSTEQFFRSPAAPRIDVAFVPAHSIAPPGVLTERRQVTEPARLEAKSVASLQRYAEALGAAVTVPASFGWRVQGTDGADLSWCNSTIFPLHPARAAERIRELGMAALTWGPGQVMTVSDGAVQVDNGPWLTRPYDFAEVYRAVSFDPSVPVPPFDPETDRVGTQREPTHVLVSRLLDELVGTDYWYRALESGTSHLLRVFDDSRCEASILDMSAHRSLPEPSHADRTGDGLRHTDISAATLQSLFDADLLFSSAYALWSSNDQMLSAVFHQPSYYMRHMEKALEQTGPARSA